MASLVGMVPTGIASVHVQRENEMLFGVPSIQFDRTTTVRRLCVKDSDNTIYAPKK
jgi:hypothetical protein